MLATGAVWAVMMSALLKREVLPYFAYQAPPTYRGLLQTRVEPERTRAAIHLGRDKRGAIDTLIEPQMDGSFRWRSVAEFEAAVPTPGRTELLNVPVSFRSEVVIDATYQLARFRWDLRSFFHGWVRGRRTGNRLRIEYEVEAMGSRLAGGAQEMDFPEDTMVGDVFQPYLGGGRLYVGKKWKIATIELHHTGFRLGTLYAAVTAREVFRVRFRDLIGFRVEVRRKPSDEVLPALILHCQEDGTAVKQKVTFENLEYVVTVEEKKSLGPEEVAEWIRRHGWSAEEDP